MCGIAGWLSPEGRVEEEVLSAARDVLAHRGPDGAGTWVSADRCVGLAHRRLSIVDLGEGGAQPMRASDHASLVFNGEIYNHAELRAELEREGVSFTSDHSDTEVLLRGYLAWGLRELLKRLNGMFAFALWDHRGRVLHLVRDRMGIKPLYVARRGRDWYFASESKALFALPGIEARLDTDSFRHYLSFRAVPAPRTLFAGVECLGAGERIEVDLERRSLRRLLWWDPMANAADPPASEDEARERLEALLEDSARLRGLADVPVGLFLSGGVDSAYLLQLMAEGREGLDSFTVTYPGHAQYDEGREAARLAGAARARHHEVPLDAEAYASALADVAYHQDEPIAAPVCTSVYFLAKAAREAEVPVVLAGEGSDELFIGYRNWLRVRDAERWNRRLPDVPGRLLRRGAAAVGQACLPWLSPYAELLRRAAADQPLFWSGSTDFGERAKRRLLAPALELDLNDTYEEVVAPLRADYLERGRADDLTGWMTYVDLRFRLPQLMLPRVDKMGMAHSVEGRVPFLDHRVVELVTGLPAAWRSGAGSEPKALFKSVAARRLPHEFVYARKRGFQAPVKEWKTGSLGARYLPALERFAGATELFDERALREVLAESGDRLYFNLTNFMLWYLTYVEDVLEGELPEVKRPATEALVAA